MNNINPLFIQYVHSDTPTIREIHLKNATHNLGCGDTILDNFYKLIFSVIHVLINRLQVFRTIRRSISSLPAKGLKTSSPFLPPRASRELRAKRNCFQTNAAKCLPHSRSFLPDNTITSQQAAIFNSHKRDILNPPYSVFKMLTLRELHTYVRIPALKHTMQ